MAWEPDKQIRKLLIEDHGMRNGRHVYRLSPFVLVERGNGEVYLEPLPALTGGFKLASVFDFSAIELVPPPAPQFKDGGVQQLTTMFSDHGALGSNSKATGGSLGIGTA